MWARDSMIALLGASLVEDAAIRAALQASLATLRRWQTQAGLIPNNFDPRSGKPNYRAYADGALWFVIGSSILAPDPDAIGRALGWYECQDVDESGLISIQEASDWQDLFCTRGKGLYVNCLYAAALSKAAALNEARGHTRQAGSYGERAERVREAVNRYLWYHGDGEVLRHISHSFSTDSPRRDSLGRERWMPCKRILRDAHYYLPYVSFREIGEWFDAFGNLLAILAGVASEEQANRILDFIAGQKLDAHPIPAIYPPVQPGDADWREYYGTLNVPHQYHNGGIWPFLGGFYVAALVKGGRFEAAEAALERLAELNRTGEFNEWHHGETGEPKGVRQQAWSAGMYIYACESVSLRKAPYW